jgi:hypothetical protein
MTVTVRNLFDQAQQLPAEEQADLIDLLLAHGQPDDARDDVAWTAEWATEIEARVRSLERGEAVAVPAEDVLAEGRRRLAAMRGGA